MSAPLVAITPASPPRPAWLRAPAPVGQNYRDLKTLIDGLGLHTVCESAACPNVGECWNHRTATFMILGNVCTRRCGFCAVQKGAPLAVDYDEPRRVAEAVAAMGLRFAVITSVNRDDRADGGAELFALTIRAIRERVPGCGVEVLVPDFQGSHAAMDIVMAAAPDVLNHNTETVPRLYRQVRLGARYERSLDMLAYAKSASPQTPVKSGLMLGLGETIDEVLAVMRDLRAHSVDILTIGQYLRPSPKHLPIVRYVPPAEFDRAPPRRIRNGLRARGIRPAGPQFLPRRGCRGAGWWWGRPWEFVVCRLWGALAGDTKAIACPTARRPSPRTARSGGPSHSPAPRRFRSRWRRAEGGAGARNSRPRFPGRVLDEVFQLFAQDVGAWGPSHRLHTHFDRCARVDGVRARV